MCAQGHWGLADVLFTITLPPPLPHFPPIPSPEILPDLGAVIRKWGNFLGRRLEVVAPSWERWSPQGFSELFHRRAHHPMGALDLG